MSRYLLDANVWLPLVFDALASGSQARAWFDGVAAGEAILCRAVQITLMRLMGNRTIVGDNAMPALDAWQVIQRLLEDERVVFLAEPPGIDSTLPRLFGYPVPTHNLISDAYLAAFAISADLQLVTFDRGFREFRGLDLLLLGA